MRRNSFRVGAPVICRVYKRSTHPGPRAQHVQPEEKGEGYQYEVEKFWTVREVDSQRIVLMTRRGKLRVMDAQCDAIRPARWWERWRYRNRFPDVSGETSSDVPG